MEYNEEYFEEYLNEPIRITTNDGVIEGVLENYLPEHDNGSKALIVKTEGQLTYVEAASIQSVEKPTE